MLRFYRVKISTLKNGEKRYTPQVGFPKLSISKFSVYPYKDWENIIFDGEDARSYSGLPQQCKSEEEALGVIKKYRAEIAQIEEREVVSTEYKEVKF